MKPVSWWLGSVAVSIVLIGILIYQWAEMNEYYVKPTHLENEQEADAYIKTNWEGRKDNKQIPDHPLLKIKTGIFIQSLQFSDSTEVSLTGYIWQRYEDGVHDHIKPDASEIGFVLPEQVKSGNDIEPREVYRLHENGEEIIGWYFEATLRQPFDYSGYPFDHKTIWIRMWHKDFFRNIVLVPDFNAYEATGMSDIFGIENRIVLGTWKRKDTYFDYKPSSYDTNFGIPGYIGQTGFPELHYNVVVIRKFENAFIIYLLPLFLVSALLFAELLTVSSKNEVSEVLGFSTSGFIAACSALFFVVMLAHIQLREQFAGTGIVYIEYFYILMYTVLVLASANTYLFSIQSNCLRGMVLYKDNIIPKIAYWPVLLICLVLITIVCR